MLWIMIRLLTAYVVHDIRASTTSLGIPLIITTAGDLYFFFFFQAEDGIRDLTVTGVQTCALPISPGGRGPSAPARGRRMVHVGGMPDRQAWFDRGGQWRAGADTVRLRPPPPAP